ncbi:MAG: hypothetical protein WD426_00030 [Anditalea sp.]
MQKLFVLPVFFILLVISSCKEDEIQPDLAVQGEWILVKSEGSMTGKVLEGEELEWKETYDFNDDNTFIKTRETDDGSFQASGEFSLIEAEISDSSKARAYLTLTFQSGEEIIIGTCNGTGKIEELIITHQGELINTWGYCDGAILYYEKNSFAQISNKSLAK